MVNQRRITARKPARVRRDVAGFGPLPAQRPDDPNVETMPPVVRIVLVPAAKPATDAAASNGVAGDGQVPRTTSTSL